MKILDASWQQLCEIVRDDDRELAELLMDEIVSCEVRRQVRQQVDRELHRRSHAPADRWLPVR